MANQRFPDNSPADASKPHTPTLEVYASYLVTVRDYALPGVDGPYTLKSRSFPARDIGAAIQMGAQYFNADRHASDAPAVVVKVEIEASRFGGCEFDIGAEF